MFYFFILIMYLKFTPMIFKLNYFYFIYFNSSLRFELYFRKIGSFLLVTQLKIMIFY
jgi:hypothetical protein